MTTISDQKANSDQREGYPSGTRQGRRSKWDNFSEIGVGAIKSVSDLVTQPVCKYGLDKPKSEAATKTLVAGRQF